MAIIPNHKHQISNKFKIRNLNDRNQSICKFNGKALVFNLDFCSLDFICYLEFLEYRNKFPGTHSNTQLRVVVN
jgi:hypothetical protein